MKNIYTFIMLLLLSLGVNAQTVNTIQGKVVDRNNNPLENVNIIIKNAAKGTTTDANGNFKLSTELDNIILLVSNMAFEKQELPIDLRRNKTTAITITLHPKTYNLEEVVVNSDYSLVENSIGKAREEQKTIPGATNLVSMKGLQTQRSLTLKDALQMQPGVMIQEFFGANDQPRLNIRGSGIQSNPQRRGVNLLQDGISMNLADGSYIIGILEPRAAEYIEVFRGANALKYGATTLGGAINLVSKNGYNASPLEVKLEGGSFGYHGGSVSSGFVSGKTDGFASISYNGAKGFTEYNTSSRLNATFNVGRKFSDNFESRLYATYTNLKFDISGPLTQRQLEKDPTVISPGIRLKPPFNFGPNVVRDKPRRASEIFRVANKNVYRINSKNKLALGAYYQYGDDTFVFPIPVGVRTSLSNDFGGFISLENKTSQNQLSLGINASAGYTNRKYFVNVRGEKGKEYGNNDLTATNFIVYAEDIYKLTPKLSGIISAQLSLNQRNNKDVYATPNKRPFSAFPPKKNAQINGFFPSEDSSLDQSYTGFNPKLGLIYDINKEQQAFFNVSRSYEPPTFDELINQAKSNPNQSPKEFHSVKLDAQTATTIELGTRGNYKGIFWDLSFYNSWVKNEILTTTDLFGISGNTRNSPDPTIHQGIELGLKAVLFRNIFGQNNDEVAFNSVYNFSNFYFKEGIYKGKQIAGIPKNYIAGSLEYKNPNGFFLNVNTEWLPEDTPTDHQNTVYQKSFQLIGCRIGYNKAHWGIFLEGKNLTNQKYASSYLIRDIVANPKPPKATQADVTTFIPGQGINFIGGIYYKL